MDDMIVDSGAVTSEQERPISLVYPRKGEKIRCNVTKNVYTIDDKIGEGNFGVVYGCYDVWGNNLAVKVLKPKGTYQAIKSSCLKEFDKLLKFRHPYIIYVHDAFEYRNTFYIVTEKCSSTLASMMKIRNFDGRVWLRPVAHCILQAVHFVHTNRYLHQDIHVGNVFSTFIKDELLPNNHQAIRFKVGDLGISRLMEEVSAESTMADWMRPPEVLAPGRFGVLDYRIDIYHLGLLFLQMILGGDIRFTPSDILKGRPRDIALSLHIPEGEVIAKALTCKVQDRIPSAMEFWRELDNVLPKSR